MSFLLLRLKHPIFHTGTLSGPTHLLQSKLGHLFRFIFKTVPSLTMFTSPRIAKFLLSLQQYSDIICSFAYGQTRTG
ncbi:unnamed protein product [Rhodiola kirilowii]